MKNITNKQVAVDLATLEEISERYRKAIWEHQEGQPAHYDRQEKAVQQVITQVYTATRFAIITLAKLKQLGVQEDSK